MSYFGVGKEEQSGRYIFSVKSDTVGAKGAQAGVYLDLLVMMLIVETPAHAYIYWMTPERRADGSTTVKGHALCTERDAKALRGLRRDLVEFAKFPARKLFSANTWQEVRSVFRDSFDLSHDMTESIIAYIQGTTSK